MLWKRTHTNPIGASGPAPSRAAQDELRGYLAYRLRLAMDFATLGAYELTGEEDLPAAGDEPERRPTTAPPPRLIQGHRSCRADRNRRESAPAHVSGAGNCPAGERDGGGCACTWHIAVNRGAGGARVRRARERRWRRAGTVPTSPQPCTWSA